MVICIGLMQGIPAIASVVDLGTVAEGTNVNATIFNSAFPSDTETYTYQQLVFLGSNLDLVLDGGLTVAEVLAADLEPADNGTLTYNFPFTFGASGSYSQDGLPIIGVSPGTTLDFTATSQSGTVYTSFNNVGAVIGVDPTNAAGTYSAILGNTGHGLVQGIPTSTTTTVTLTLGIIGDTVYEGEDVTTTWEDSGQVSSAGLTATPEPSTFWFALAGLCAVLVTRRVQR